MSLKLKIWLLLGGAVLLLTSLLALLDYRAAEAHGHEILRKQALDLRAALMATRRVYHQQFIDSGLPLDDRTLGFLPAHALSRIARDYPNWTHSGIYFNNVSDQPRNPLNQADADELAAIAWFQNNPDAREYTALIHDASGREFFQFAAPIRTEPYCLQCHASREAAPSAISERYTQGYDYAVNDLRGIMSIRIPSESGRLTALAHSRHTLVTQASLLGMLFVVLGLLLNHYVTRRIAAMQTATRRISEGDHGVRLADARGDEIGALAGDFNAMAGAIEQREQALLASEARFAGLFEHMQLGFALHRIITDAAGQAVDYVFLMVNPAFRELTGLRDETLIGRRVSELLPGIRDEPADWIGRYGRVALTGEPTHFTAYNPALDKWFAVVAYRPEPGLFAALFSDVSEQQRTRELERYAAFQGGIAEMSTAILHNIGNAITVVTQDAEMIEHTGKALQRVADLLADNATRGMARLTERDTPPNASPATAEAQLVSQIEQQCAIQREAARAINRLHQDELHMRARRLSESVRHIAGIIHVQQHAALPDARRSSFSLTGAIRAALDMQGESYTKRDIQVTVAVDECVDTVNLSHNRMLQALINILRNSLEAIDERQRQSATPGRLTISAAALDAHHLRLSIEDNGIGFDPRAHEDLFRFGYSTKQRGSGFGLHSVAMFVQESGGQVRLESAGQGLGARLTMDLPRNAAYPAPPQPPELAREHEARAPRAGQTAATGRHEA